MLKRLLLWGHLLTFDCVLPAFQCLRPGSPIHRYLAVSSARFACCRTCDHPFRGPCETLHQHPYMCDERPMGFDEPIFYDKLCLHEF